MQHHCSRLVGRSWSHSTADVGESSLSRQIPGDVLSYSHPYLSQDFGDLQQEIYPWPGSRPMMWGSLYKEEAALNHSPFCFTSIPASSSPYLHFPEQFVPFTWVNSKLSTSRKDCLASFELACAFVCV